MFGYIRPSPPELKVREYDLYKAMYCGLCKAMGRHICRSSRLTLSYDIVFLAAVRAAAANEKITIKKRRCAVHPFKKRPVAECDDALAYSARASAVLTYYKAADDVNDSKGFKKAAKKLFMPFARKNRKKAALPELDAEIAGYIDRLSEIERSGGTAEECADLFGETLAAVFSHSFGDKNDERILSDFGFHIGRWIYFIDAADDFEKDKKSGGFNPFSEYDPFPAEDIESATNLDLAAAEQALLLLSAQNGPLYNVIQNIIYIGMPDTAKSILEKRNERKSANE